MHACMHTCAASLRHPPSGTPEFTTTKPLALGEKHRHHHALGIPPWHPFFRPAFTHTSQPPPKTSTENPYHFMIRRTDHRSAMHGSLYLTYLRLEICITYHFMSTRDHGPHHGGRLCELTAVANEVNHHRDLVQ
jgi:hypothetical protein